MNPLRIKLEDFMNHRLSDIDCTPFKSALIVAKNKNNDRESNGVGKTTIYSAIEYALFGDVPTSVVDKVVRDGAKKCVVTFDFELRGHIYRVVRGRSCNGRPELKVYESVNDKWEKISGTRIPEAEKKIANLIKLNSKAFGYAIKFAQADLSGLSETDKSSERLKMLKEPLQLSPYTKLEKVVSDRIKPIKKDIERTDASIQILGDPVSDIKAAKAELQYCEASIKSKEVSINKCKTVITEKQKQIESLKKTISSSDTDIHNKIEILSKRSKELKSTIAAANERVQKNNHFIDENKRNRGVLRKKLSDANDKLISLNKKNIRSRDLIVKDLEKTKNDELYGTKLLATYEAEYDAANKSLPSGNVCPHCLQSITSEHRKVCELEANKTLEEKSIQIKNTKFNLTKCSNKKQRLEEELREVMEHEQEARMIEHQIQSNQSELDLLSKHIDEAESRLATALQEMESARSEIQEVISNIEQFKKMVQTSSSDAEINAKILELQGEVKVYDRSLENVHKELSEAQKRQGAAQEKLKVATLNLDKLKTFKSELVELKAKLNIHQLTINAFSPAGIPTFIIHTILDELQLEANQWLQKLRPELELEFDENVEMFYRVNGMQRERKQLSVGQRVYIALALKLGLSRVIQKKLGIDIRFLLLDEVDQSLDEAGVDAFAETVRKLQDEFKIFVITHNNNLKNKFSHTILVEGDGKNGATSQVVTSW